MHEQILIAPNGTELLRTLARHGCNTLGLRIMQPAELAAFMLMRSGISLTETQIAADTEAALIWRFLPEIRYFKNASYHDAQNLANTLRTLRLQISGSERETIVSGLKLSKFSEKSAALIEVYDRYTDALKQRQLIDQAGLMRQAISRAKPLRAECLVLREYPLTPLEQALAEKAADGTPKVVSLRELLNKSAQPLPLPHITETYGAVNEVENVIASIYRSQIPLDQCTVAVTDSSYAMLFFEAAKRFGIPVTFGFGLPVTLTNPAQILRDYLRWMTVGHCGIDALRDLLNSPAFDKKQFCTDFGISHTDRFIRTAGAMRLGTDIRMNQQRIDAYRASGERDKTEMEQLNAVFVKLGMNCAKLIWKYTRIRKNDLGRLDKAAQLKLCKSLEHFSEMTGEPAEKLIPDLLNVSIGAQNSEAGALHITTVSGALTALRQNLFVMGLSAERFPGEPTENYLLLDDEMTAFGKNAPTSGNMIRQAQSELHDLLENAAAIGVRTELSYCGYDAAELKANNASSVLYALYLEAGGTDVDDFGKSIRKTGYFSQDLPGLTAVGRAYLNGETVLGKPAESSDVTDISSAVSVLSPSKIEKYVQCPKSFCYECIMGLQELESDDVFEVISPQMLGILVHEAMEFCCGTMPGKQAFLDHAEQIFDRFLTERPPMNAKDALQPRHDFLRAVENGYDAVAGMKIESAEDELSAVYDCGITVQGRPDAIAKLPDGSLRILDYKSGRTLKHTDEDLRSCIQVMLYADMLKKHGTDVTGGDYLYVYLDGKVSCAYNEDRSAKISDLLTEIDNAAKIRSFPANPSKENCRYCAYINICGEGKAK